MNERLCIVTRSTLGTSNSFLARHPQDKHITLKLVRDAFSSICVEAGGTRHEDTSEDTGMSSKEDAFKVNVLKFTGDIRLKQ